MRVVVRKCPFTGKIFEESKIEKYKAHLIEVRNAKRTTRLHNNIREGFNIWLANEKSNIFYPEDIFPWLLKNQEYLMEASNAMIDVNSRDRYAPDDRYIALSADVEYKETLSNTHSCPSNGVLNWRRHEDKPLGYPGWYGHIKGKLLRSKKNNYSYPYTNILKLVRVHTGSGGGGNESWNFDISIFLADWPALKEGLTFSKLKNG